MISPKTSIPQHIIITLLKIRDKVIKATREKQHINHKRTQIQIKIDFSSETMKVRGKLHIFQLLKDKTANGKFCILQKSSGTKGEFADEGKLKESYGSHALEKCLKEIQLTIEKRQFELPRST